MEEEDVKSCEHYNSKVEGIPVDYMIIDSEKTKNLYKYLFPGVGDDQLNQEKSGYDVQSNNIFSNIHKNSSFIPDLNNINEKTMSYNESNKGEIKHKIISQNPNTEQKQDIVCLHRNKKNKMDSSDLDGINRNKLFSESINKVNKQLHIKGRKLMKDNMRKRIKSDFYRKLKKKLNDKIKTLKLNEPNFDFAQYMIIDVTKEYNIKNLNMTLKEVLLEQHEENCCIQKNKEIINKYLKKDDTFDIILEKQIKYLFNKYLNSEEFQESIKKLSEEENYDYIYEYINVADNFIKDFINEEIEKNNEFQIFNKIQNNYKLIYNDKPIFSQFYPNIGKRDSEIKYLNRKRIRTNFYQFIIEKLNELTNSKKYSFRQSMKNDKINKEIANLTLKKVLDKKIIFSEINESLNIEELNNENNELDTFLKMTIKDIYKKLYLNSEHYSLSIEELEEENVYSYEEEAKRIFDFQ